MCNDFNKIIKLFLYFVYFDVLYVFPFLPNLGLDVG